jgi:hypothetical protein
MYALGRAFDAWYGVVRDWICSWTGQLRDRDLRREECRISATIRVGGKPRLYGSGVATGQVLPMGERASTPDEMVAAFGCASAGYDLPLPHTLLMRARAELTLGDNRQAVIDACTAAEVSLGNAVRASLNAAGVPEKTAENILRQSSGAVELFRLFIIAGARPVLSDSRVMDKLAKPRNDAVHAGSRSTVVDARKAIETATLIVKSAACPARI